MEKSEKTMNKDRIMQECKKYFLCEKEKPLRMIVYVAVGGKT